MSDLQSAVAALTALVVALTGLVPAVMLLWKKVSRQGRLLEDFWEGHLLRGKVEALQRGLAVEWFDTSNGSPEQEGDFMPLAVRQLAHALYDPIRVQLMALRGRFPVASETEMAQMIERRFGGWLARNVCMKLGVNQFACVVMAISVADDIPPVPESKHD